MTKEEKKVYLEERLAAKKPWKGRKGLGGFGTSTWGFTAKLTDKSKVGRVTWAKMKDQAMKPDYKESDAYLKHDETTRDFIDNLIKA